MARRTPPPQLIGSGLIPENFQSEYDAYEDAFQTKLAGLGRDERSLFADYGFRGGVGTDGSVDFQIDPTAQYGRYQQLLRNIGGQLGQAKTEMRGRGIGRAGLAKARENLLRFMMSGEKTNLLTNFNNSAGGIFGQRGGALTDRNRGFSGVEGRALDWWNQYGPDDPDGNVSEDAPSMAPSMVSPYGPQQPLYSQPPGYTDVGEPGYAPNYGAPAGPPVIPPTGGYDPYPDPNDPRRRGTGNRNAQTM